LSPFVDDPLAVMGRIDPKYKPVWAGRSEAEQLALARYFLPHRSGRPLLGPTRPRVVKWYCPFADQRQFPAGHRYCINVYTGCAHGCEYCYAAAYTPDGARTKDRFASQIERDMEDLERFDVPPAPVHLSNSTDPFQPLEIEARHTQLTLERIVAYRRRFTSVVVLTRNPLLASRPPYIELLRSIGEPCRVEVSLAFNREEARRVYDPHAPTVADRVAGILALRRAGIPVALRIDPLLPPALSELGLPEAQTRDDLESLVRLAADAGVTHVVWSVVKVVRSRAGRLSPVMQAVKAAFERMAGPRKLVFRGGSWRLPEQIAADRMVHPFLELCRRHRVSAEHCMDNLLRTR